jgi:uncharacterized membrane protein YsdA (DUF1294 family)
LTVFLLALSVVASLVSIALYGVDKRAAAVGRRRIPERTLHLTSLIGGWPGAFLAQRVFRHKTRKAGFLAVFWGTVLVHLGVIATIAHYCSR